MERWIIAGIFVIWFALMLFWPELLIRRSRPTKALYIAASRAVGLLGLLGIGAMVVAHFVGN